MSSEDTGSVPSLRRKAQEKDVDYRRADLDAGGHPQRRTALSV